MRSHDAQEPRRRGVRLLLPRGDRARIGFGGDGRRPRTRLAAFPTLSTRGSGAATIAAQPYGSLACRARDTGEYRVSDLTLPLPSETDTSVLPMLSIPDRLDDVVTSAHTSMTSAPAASATSLSRRAAPPGAA